jgi:predicted anti-sigma-YlaC factor YlaD
MRNQGLGGRHVTGLLGVYVLGGLRGHEETRVRAHLARCARCRADYEDLAEVPILLNMITAEDAADPEGLAEQVYAKDAVHRLLPTRRANPGDQSG